MTKHSSETLAKLQRIFEYITKSKLEARENRDYSLYLYYVHGMNTVTDVCGA